MDKDNTLITPIKVKQTFASKRLKEKIKEILTPFYFYQNKLIVKEFFIF